MIFKVPYKVLNTLGKIENEEGDRKHPYIEQISNKWKDDWEFTEIDSKKLSTADFNLIKDFIINDKDETDERILKIYGFYKKKLSTYEKLMDAGSSIVLKSLTEVEISFYSFVKEFPNHRFYKEDDFGNLLPWRAMSAVWVKATKDCREHVSIQFAAHLRGENITTSFSVFVEDIKGYTLGEILTNRNFLAENDETNNQYEADLIKFEKCQKSTGKVFLGSGKCQKKNSRWYYNSSYYFKADGSSTKVVMDHSGYHVENDSKEPLKNPSLNSSVVNDYVSLPIHPFTTVFHLEDHIWLDVHVNNLEEYKFKGLELMKKLILPKSHTTLINILMEMSQSDLEDIIEGKKGGSFIMCTGVPGTGKTLSAEVFSEVMGLPLYKVQCSQLGLSIDAVEKNLKQVLTRSTRWGAILLIDEADVYVRERSNDIMQNAIVGVFLRTLEYYTGILFMTSNMATCIDDAIMSRATAHLIYEIPIPEDLKKIWKVLDAQFETKLSEENIDRLVIEIPNIVGRDVKALLKLAKMYASKQGVDCSVDLIKQISSFVPNVAKKTIDAGNLKREDFILS